MRARLIQAWEYLRSSYWFIPTIMSLIAAAAAFICVRIDHHVGDEALRASSYLYTSTPDAARTLLATIAGSMITVAGVTFAITISSVGYATSQFGPRILTNFMRDRGNQISLGAFLANFLYCLLVLRSVQSAVDDYESVTTFIPHIAILVALTATIGCAGILIYYIHHVPQSIHVANVLSAIGHDLSHKIEELFPEQIGRDTADIDAGRNPAEASSNATIDVLAKYSGYIQTLDDEGLIEVAKDADMVVTLRCRPGDFVYPGNTLATIVATKGADPDELIERVRSVFAFGARRTPGQDSRFLVNELIEIAARALSPGQNDPYTAISAINWLKAALATRLSRRTPSSARFDDAKVLRVIAPTSTAVEMIDNVFDQLRPYTITDRNAGLAFIEAISQLAHGRATGECRERLHTKANEFLDGIVKQDWQACDVDRVQKIVSELP